jgi:hypothetical protein
MLYVILIIFLIIIFWFFYIIMYKRTKSVVPEKLLKINNFFDDRMVNIFWDNFLSNFKDYNHISFYQKGLHIAIKKNHIIGIITNYNWQNPKEALEFFRKYVNNTKNQIIIFDLDPQDLSNLKLTNNDIVISTKLNENIPLNGHKIYMPYYLWHMKYDAKIPFSSLIKREQRLQEKRDFCVFAYSNCIQSYEGVRNREKFYYMLQEASGNRITNLGKCCGEKRTGDHYSNTETFTNFKFVIAFENQPLNGYISEKLTNAMVSGAIPIYLGAPDVGNYFNTKSFIHVRDFNTYEDCIKYVLQVDNDNVLYESIKKEPWLKNNVLNDVFLQNISIDDLIEN